MACLLRIRAGPFFFPGFEPGTGGLLREPELLERRDAHDVEARRRYWRGIGFEPPADGSTVVSVFAYPEAPLTALLGHWQHAAASHVVAVPTGALAAVAAGFFGCTGAAAGTTVRRGALELRVLPFVPQRQYDELLWSADCNFVRGEDTLVRAQWAARPYVWHAYAQAEQAHRMKLDALLDLYCGGMQDDAAASAVRDLWRAWNQTQRTPVALGPAWDRYWAQRAALAAHGRAWARRLAEAGELAENLAEFAREKLK
jgi:uncharacterized repeat protein (TIGR03837 family)